MSSAAPVLSASTLETALKALGPYSLALAFMVGAYFFLLHESDKDEATAIRRDARETRLIALLEKQHTTYIDAVSKKLIRMDAILTKINERGDALVPTIVRLSRALNLDVDVQARENERQ